MTAAISAATIAFVLALFLGVFIGRHIRDSGWPRGLVPARFFPRRAAAGDGGQRVATPRTRSPEPTSREVPASAEARDSDVRSTTSDGRMTKAGLLSMVVRNSSTAVAVVDEFRDVVLYNQRAVELGMVREMLLADPVWDAVKEILDTGAERHFEFSPPTSSLGFVSTGRTPRPTVEHVRCLARLVAQGDERYAVVYGLDDTEHKRVEATRRDFVANVSHELKTPVGAIGLLAEAMLESADDTDSVQHFGRRVVGETKRMGNMVSELLALSRLQGGDTPEFTRIDVDALIDDAIAASTLAAEAAAIELRADAPISVTIRGDRLLLLTALNNLIANAISYSPSGTTVSVSRRVIKIDGRPMVAIAVTDRGIGIAPADQQRVFERFFRVDQARSRLTGGTGLGLAIVKHVAANHGGTINLWSKPGTGSTFTLCIPEDLSDAGWPDETEYAQEPAARRPAVNPPSGDDDKGNKS
ncbi:two-component sensor histidine kinase [Gordonia sp. zg691]|uniref:Sensor-like histidine kinase SenX3 n=1 Tax=Gordonia jinghuaiqii TaxID=2758710 RepID=A0A7D7R3N4_9ACTN|nr:ATP-binding protein [Gordonia jinghuaiqii]MBD0861854.1 two-component sensor histidine kinase [Gordonia jinghuaiqii]MCR5977746.1 two-component sensor histidine kinase [Gordonia jinghuaiqii]QMT02407.1 two-component sensor histidine kinase [Gordonia jinghuaiqii]